MALTDFFRINLPYGIRRNSKNQWIAFNREYLPLGGNNSFDLTKTVAHNDTYSYLSLHTEYKRLTEKTIMDIAQLDKEKWVKDQEYFIRRDNDEKIQILFLYTDSTNPMTYPEKWDIYCQKLRLLARLKRKNE
jgi:hypothetical protein